MTFKVATWNILATSYIRRDFYPRTPPEALDPERRIPALAGHAATLDADILCLQEVEVSAYAALHQSLEGYSGVYAAKGHNRPDGCATFVRDPFQIAGEQRIAYADGHGGRDSGHIAQLLTLEARDGRRLAILNTHLKWDPPRTERSRQLGYRQILLAFDALAKAGPVDARILCGDFNVTSESEVFAALRAAGMADAHRECTGIATCNSNRQAKLIDYIFFSGALCAKPIPPEPIGDETTLPSAEHPSDHLPLIAEFNWLPNSRVGF